MDSLQIEHYDAPHAKTFVDDMADTGQRVQHFHHHPWEGPAVECTDTSFVMKSTSCRCRVIRLDGKAFVAPRKPAPLNLAGEQFMAEMTR